jgi:RNA polymerase sigma-70 factor (ECF subfamily)
VETLVNDPGVENATPPGLEPSGFADLYHEHSKAVYYLALRYLGDPQRAEDVTHDVFLKVYRKLDEFRGESAFRTWLYRITINHCHNIQASWHNRHITTTDDEAVLDATPASVSESPLRILEVKELGERIAKTMDGLTPEYRLLLLLVADEEMSYEEIAELTGQTSDAVRGKLHRARKAFAALFAKSA